MHSLFILHYFMEFIMSNYKEVRVIAFFTKKVARPIGPIPDNYLANEENMPQELISEMKKNGWVDESGVYSWSRKFKPAPVKGNDGNVYICMSDADLENKSRFSSRIQEATNLLYS